jgi:hypothetical protein
MLTRQLLAGHKTDLHVVAGESALDVHRSGDNGGVVTCARGRGWTVDQPVEQKWRGKAAFLASKLNRAHLAVHALAATLERGHTRLALRRYRSVREQIASLSEEVKAMRSEQPTKGPIDDDATAEGSALAIRGSDAATIALDVMVDAMAALNMTDHGVDVDVLIGACIDAEQAFRDSVAIVQATSEAHGSAIRSLKNAFDTDGEIALRERVWNKRAAVQAINERAEALVP